jgi:hypothetical protein
MLSFPSFFWSQDNLIRHFTLISNVKNGEVIDPQKVKHGEISALKISNLSGWIDPQTHLNLDFPKHLIREVYIAKNLELGSKVMIRDERLMAAFVSPQAYKHLGFVDEAERTEQLREAISKEIKNKEKVVE